MSPSGVHLRLDINMHHEHVQIREAARTLSRVGAQLPRWGIRHLWSAHLTVYLCFMLEKSPDKRLFLFCWFARFVLFYSPSWRRKLYLHGYVHSLFSTAFHTVVSTWALLHVRPFYYSNTSLSLTFSWTFLDLLYNKYSEKVVSRALWAPRCMFWHLSSKSCKDGEVYAEQHHIRLNVKFTCHRKYTAKLAQA